MPVFSFTIMALDKRGASASASIANVIDLIDRSGLRYRLNAMSTVIEGEWEAVMRVINKARLLLRRSHERVYLIITVDDRKGAGNRLRGKIASIETRLGRKVEV